MLKDFLKKYLSAPKVENVAPNRNCSEFEVDNWMVSDFIIKKILPVAGARPFPLTELMLMVSSVCYYQPKFIFEWGTHIGKSARIFYETLKYFKLSGEVHSIDLPDNIEHVEHPKNERGKLVRGLDNVFLHQGDGLNMSLKLFDEVDKTSPMLFFLDGDHSYESVKRELLGISDKVASPLILAHDTFYQSEGSKYNIGPYQAISEFLQAQPEYKLVSCTNTGLPGMTLIAKK